MRARKTLHERMDALGWTPTTTGCWEWNGQRVKGYGRIRSGGATEPQPLVHRIAFERWVRPLEYGEVVRHRCDNPPCINPAHLEAGSHADNVADKVARGRGARGEGHGLHKLRATDVLAIREAIGKGTRQKDLAAEYGVTKSTVSLIARGKKWKHLLKASAQVGFIATIVFGLTALDRTVPAQASDAPYFTVSSTEIVACYTTDPGTLDANVKFEDGTRLNFHPWPYTLTAGCYTFTLPTGHGLPTWVQVHGFNCHIGEDNTGREQNCSWLPTTTPTEEPTWTPEPTPSDEPTPSETQSETPEQPSPQPSTTPSEPATPGTTPSDDTPPSTPEPQPEPTGTTPEQPSTPPTTPGPTPETPSPSPTPSTEPVPPTSPSDPTEPAATPTPIQPEETPWPTPSASVTSSASSGTPGTPTKTPTQMTTQPKMPGSQPATTSPSLAVTGSNDTLVGVVTILMVVILGLFLVVRTRSRR